MMNLLKSALRWILVSCFLLTLPAIGYAQLTLDGEVRPRTEFRNGYGTLSTSDSDPAFFTSQRTRLTLNYQSDLYEIKLSGQDVRVWGDVQQLQSNANVNIHEAWAEFVVTEAVDIRLGRQELVYDDQRLLGSVNWTQQARSHDALLLKYQDSDIGLRLDFGGAYNQESENLLGNTYTLNNYKVLSYLWLHKNLGGVNASILGLADGFEQPGGANFRYTYGTHLVYDENDLELNGSVYLQNGNDNIRNDISAYMFAARAGYNFNMLKLTAGYDYLSGSSIDENNPQRKAFHTLYATNHKFYGNMDYFLNVPTDTRFGGLQDIYVQASYNVNNQSSLSLTYHNFALAKSIADPLSDQTLDRSLGSEFDFSIKQNFTSEISLNAGYSLLLPANTLERLQQVDARSAQHWGWLMLSLTPNFLD